MSKAETTDGKALVRDGPQVQRTFGRDAVTRRRSATFTIGGRADEDEAAGLERGRQAVHEVEVDLAGEEVAREAEHRPSEMLQGGWSQAAVDRGGEVLEVPDVANEMGLGVHLGVALVEGARGCEDEPRHPCGPPVGGGDETPVAVSRGLLHVVVDAVVHREAVSGGADRPRRNRVVEPGDARVTEAGGPLARRSGRSLAR